MKRAKFINQRLIWIILIITLVISVACINSNVDPTDPRLQPPLSTLGKGFNEFLKWLDLAPGRFIMAPWITKPDNFSYKSDRIIEVSGWAEYYLDGKIVVYEVVPEVDLSGVKKELQPLSYTFVEKDTNSWSVLVELPKEKQFIAARLERESEKSKYYSNIIYISTGEGVALTITSPTNDEVVSTDTVNIEGTGEPGLGLEVYVNDENVKKTTQIGTSGKWVITDVPLLISGFDKDSPTAEFKLTVKAEATNQEKSVSIRRMEPISLVWPFGDGEGENYDPNPEVGTVTAFFGNDWHLIVYGDSHPALDISTSSEYQVGREIHAVADGTVVQSGWNQYSGGYIVVDSGGFGILYLHIMEGSIAEKYEPKTPDECKEINTKEFPQSVTVGSAVKKGEIIGTEGFTHKCRGNTTNFPTHLHIQVFIWGPGINKSNYGLVYKQIGVNINPPKTDQIQTHLSKKNINLYDWWGGSPYCAKEGCWDELDWTEVNTNPVDEEYEQGSLDYLKCLKVNCAYEMLEGLSTRLRYCSAKEGRCNNGYCVDCKIKKDCCGGDE